MTNKYNRQTVINIVKNGTSRQDGIKILNDECDLSYKRDNELNGMIETLVRLNAGPTDPATMTPSCAYPYMIWPDTTNRLLKQRTADNTAWVTIGVINADGTFALNSNALADVVTTATANKILKLDANAKLPASITGVPLAWQPTKSYAVGDICYSPNAPSYTRMECIQGGTSGTTEPTWPAVGQTVTDGTVTWKVSDIRDTRDASFVQVLTPVTISYNAAGQPETVTSEGKTYTMTYDQYKRLDTVSDGLKTIRCQYNDWGQFTGTVIVS